MAVAKADSPILSGVICGRSVQVSIGVKKSRRKKGHDAIARFGRGPG